MIRELTKSATSFSWALSLLTLKQGYNLLRPGQQGGGDLFAPMTQVAVSALDESMKGFYRSGDGMQSRMVDMAFSMMNPTAWFNPGAWQSMGNWMNPASWMGSATNFTRSAMGGCCGQSGSTQPSPPASSGPQGSPGGSFGVSSPSQAPDAGWGSMPGSHS